MQPHKERRRVISFGKTSTVTAASTVMTKPLIPMSSATVPPRFSGCKDYWLNIYNNVNFGTQRYASTYQHLTEPWSVENRGGAWPRLGGNANREETSFWLDDLSYLRLKNIQFGYNVPKALLNRVRLSNVRLFVSSENVATFTKFRGLDPEKAGNKSDAYPLNKTYSFGINVGI